MKILFLSRYSFPRSTSGGTGIAVYELIKELSAAGNDVEHWTWPPPNGGLLESKAVPGDLAKLQRFFQGSIDTDNSDLRLNNILDIVRTNSKMLEQLSDERFDVIHVHSWESFLFAIVAKYFWEVPLFFTTHDVMAGGSPSDAEVDDLYEFGLYGESSLMREADAIFCVSKINENRVLSMYRSPSPRTIVIPNGVDLEVFSPSTEAEDLPDEIKDLKGFVLFVGRAVATKGIERIILAAKSLPSSIPFVFAIGTLRSDGLETAGAGEYIDILEKLSKERTNVFVLRDVWRRESVATLHSKATVVVMPSIYEPGGLVALEAQACGTPVIASDTGFMSECVIPGVTGFLIDNDLDDLQYSENLSRAITNIFNDDDLGSNMGLAARANIVELHSWTSRASAHLAAYSEARIHTT